MPRATKQSKQTTQPTQPVPQHLEISFERAVERQPEPEPEPPRRSHLTYVETLPDDCLRITKYLDHTFANLFYSPSNDTFYQSPKPKYRVLAQGKTSINCRSDADKTVRVSLKKLKQLISDVSSRARTGIDSVTNPSSSK